jgi:leader peptidase (prepilin peptidase)/N-methyltransferase
VSVTDLHDAAAATGVAALTALAGVAVGGALVRRGLAHLEVSASRRARAAGYGTGALAGVAAVLAARHAGSWWLLPGLLAWSYGLAAAATCDAITQRVPTPLVRQAALTTAVLVLTATAATAHWRWAVLAAISAAAAAVIFAFCWRFLGAGFGDVRLAVLGGIGLAQPTRAGLVAAIAAFTVISLGQAAATLARGGNRRTPFPYGPCIAVAFLVSAIV